jgi:flagellin
MNQEFTEMAAEIDRITGSTSFNGNDLLSATGTDVNIHVGTDEQIAVEAHNMTTAADGLNIATGTGATSLTSTTGVASADSAGYFTYTEAGETGTLTIQFTDTEAGDDEVAISFDFASGYSVTLNELVDAINTASWNLPLDANGNVQAYAMASVYHDTESGNNFLKLTSRDGGVVDDLTAVVTSTGGVPVVGGTGGWATEAGLQAEMDAPVIETGINITTAANALTALDAITEAITAKDTARASFGYKMNRLESTISILNIQAENLMTAESRISDVDVATEMATMTRTQVLVQAGVAMLAQANAMPQMALSLLR